MCAFGWTHREHGAVVVERVEEAVAAADVVIMMLFDTPAIRTLVMDSPAVREVLRGKIVVNAGTVAPTDNVRLRQEVLDLGGEFVEAPVLGATPVAHQGTLQVSDGFLFATTSLERGSNSVVVAGAGEWIEEAVRSSFSGVHLVWDATPHQRGGREGPHVEGTYSPNPR